MGRDPGMWTKEVGLGREFDGLLLGADLDNFSLIILPMMLCRKFDTGNKDSEAWLHQLNQSQESKSMA